MGPAKLSSCYVHHEWIDSSSLSKKDENKSNNMSHGPVRSMGDYCCTRLACMAREGTWVAN